MFAVLVQERLRQKDYHEFKASLGCIAKPSSINNKQTDRKNP